MLQRSSRKRETIFHCGSTGEPCESCSSVLPTGKEHKKMLESRLPALFLRWSGSRRPDSDFLVRGRRFNPFICLETNPRQDPLSKVGFLRPSGSPMMIKNIYKILKLPTLLQKSLNFNTD